MDICIQAFTRQSQTEMKTITPIISFVSDYLLVIIEININLIGATIFKPSYIEVSMIENYWILAIDTIVASISKPRTMFWIKFIAGVGKCDFEKSLKFLF